MSAQAQPVKRVAPDKPVNVRRSRTPVRERFGAWRTQHLHGFFSSLGRLAARPWASGLTVFVLGFALALPLLFWLVYDNARDLSGGMREAREVTVFLKPALDAKAASALASELRKREDVSEVVERTPEQGLAEFRQLSGFGDALDALQDNPLPSVLVVTPKSGGPAEDHAARTVLWTAGVEAVPFARHAAEVLGVEAVEQASIAPPRLVVRESAADIL